MPETLRSVSLGSAQAWGAPLTVHIGTNGVDESWPARVGEQITVPAAPGSFAPAVSSTGRTAENNVYAPQMVYGCCTRRRRLQQRRSVGRLRLATSTASPPQLRRRRLAYQYPERLSAHGKLRTTHLWTVARSGSPAVQDLEDHAPKKKNWKFVKEMPRPGWCGVNPTTWGGFLRNFQQQLQPESGLTCAKGRRSSTPRAFCLCNEWIA